MYYLIVLGVSFFLSTRELADFVTFRGYEDVAPVCFGLYGPGITRSLPWDQRPNPIFLAAAQNRKERKEEITAIERGTRSAWKSKTSKSSLDKSEENDEEYKKLELEINKVTSNTKFSSSSAPISIGKQENRIPVVMNDITIPFFITQQIEYQKRLDGFQKNKTLLDFIERHLQKIKLKD